MPASSLRPARASDLAFLRSMLHEAAFWRPDSERPPLDEALRDPHLAVYLDGWGRDGDRGRIAEQDGDPLGAVWVRRFDDEAHGYGYVAEAIPELTIAVAPGHRRQGIGRALLEAVLADLRRDGTAAVSLSVETDNPARTLYEQVGFTLHRRETGAVTLIRTLREP